MIKAIIKKGQYFDSVSLMLISRELSAMSGVEEASLVMATVENLTILKAAGMQTADVADAKDTDLIIAIKAADENAVKVAMEKAEALLKNSGKKSGQTKTQQPRDIDSAIKILPDASLVLISVAGKYAAKEAEKAINKGLHVMLFSDNVAVEDEIRLKKLAINKGLLVMGPDCGTAIINGIPLAFANVVNRGNIGIVGASGTGIQEVSSIISNLGGGISQAIGTGGRDVKKEVQGMMFIEALMALDADKATEIIVLISKPPAPSVQQKISDFLSWIEKPVVAIFLGGEKLYGKDNIYQASTLKEAAEAAVAISLQKNPVQTIELNQKNKLPELQQMAETMVKSAKGKYIRGLFCGGTLCDEAQLILKNEGISCYSNIAIDKPYQLTDVWSSKENTLIDMGDDDFTRGRPHPMIDYTLRNKRIIKEAEDKDTAILLLDVVLGYGSHLKPAEDLVPVIQMAKQKNSHLQVICSVTGTNNDPQNREQVMASLQKAGAVVLPTNCDAAMLAACCLKKLK